MLNQDGTITFGAELAGIVDAFLAEYEAQKGPLRNDLERGLVISYALGVMHCELEAIWDVLGKAPVFGSLHPRVVFEDCVGKDNPVAVRRRAAVEEDLRRRAWLPERKQD